MTNPDREELVKLADGLEGYSKKYSGDWSRACPTIAWTDLTTIITALRRLASSDGGVKGEPVAWRFDHADGTHSFHSEKLSPGLMKHCVPLYTAPPADAGMREALERLKQGIRDIAQACVDGRVCDDVAWFTEIPAETLFDKCCNLLGEDLPTGQSALTAPGSTTKSDVEALAATTAERPGTVTSEPEPSTSDPSSTRSEVTVEELAATLCKACGDYWWQGGVYNSDNDRWRSRARALLEQFQITRRK